jgi:hypothetical protein
MNKLTREEWIKILDYGYDTPLWAKIIDLVTKNSELFRLKDKKNECPQYCICVNDVIKCKKELQDLLK